MPDRRQQFLDNFARLIVKHWNGMKKLPGARKHQLKEHSLQWTGESTVQGYVVIEVDDADEYDVQVEITEDAEVKVGWITGEEKKPMSRRELEGKDEDE